MVYLIAGGGFFLLARADTLLVGCVAAGLIGVGAGGEADITPYLLTRYFGLHAFSTLYGFTWTFYAIAGAIGPVILGRAFDSTGSYTSLLNLLAVAMALAGALMLLLPRIFEGGQRELNPALRTPPRRRSIFNPYRRNGDDAKNSARFPLRRVLRSHS